MKVQFELTIGENKFTLTEDVDSHTDFFKKLNFYSTLPKTGPNGETDLVLRHRLATTKEGKKVDYYSIVSEKAKKEFKFGQSQVTKDALFPKGWEPLFQKDGAEEGAESQAGGFQAPQPAQAAPTPAPTQTAPAPRPAQAPAAAFGGFALPKTTAPKQAAPEPQAPATPPVNPQVQNQAASILSKFGIG